jgi:hypothetical protein
MRRHTLVRDRSRAYELAIEAHQYLYPLVLMDVIRRQATSVDTADEILGRAPANTFAHLRSFPPVAFHDVPRPNLDVLYSFAWIDVTAGPVILSVPDAGDRYYTLPVYDMWSDVFASPGTRTSGNSPAVYALVETGWVGELPADARRIDAPTPYVWVIGRLQCDGEDDYPYVNRFQDELKLTVLPDGRPPRRAGVEGAVDGATPAFALVDAMEPLEFLGYATELLQLHPPHPTDHAVLQRMERLGIVVGERLDPTMMPRAALESLRSAFAESKLNLFRRSKSLGWTRNGWLMNTETMGAWGSDYLKAALPGRRLQPLPEALLAESRGARSNLGAATRALPRRGAVGAGAGEAGRHAGALTHRARGLWAIGRVARPPAPSRPCPAGTPLRPRRSNSPSSRAQECR